MKNFLLIPLFVLICVFGSTNAAMATDYPFSVTTSSISSGGTFSFVMTAIGTFYVDCGSGGTLSGTGVSGTTITRTNTSISTYTCTYSSSGVKTIRFGGLATGYSTGCCDGDSAAINFNRGTPSLVESISGSLGTIFPTLGNSNSQQPKFISTFNGTRITSIPEGLFTGVTGSTAGMFDWTFYGCTRLTSIPANLFSGISGCGEWMFSGVFRNCSGLTSLPTGLFRGITSACAGLFSNAFNGCTSLSGYIPSTFFSGLIANGSPNYSYFMENIFYDTGLSTSCPSGTTQYITGYESYWNGKVSCSTGTTINLTWDGVVQTPSACTLGGTFVPPTPEPRQGYVFVGWKVKNITYTQLQYIQSSGSQFINTGIYSSGPGLKSEVQLQLTTSSTSEMAIVGRNTRAGYEVYFTRGNTIGVFHESYGQSAVVSLNYTTGTTYTITSEMTSNSVTNNVNGTQASYNGSMDSMDSAEVCLFRHNYNYYISAKLYYAKLWNNGTLVRDFVPARRSSDNAIGLYDKINNRFFPNSGSGSFTAGPDVGQI